MNSDYQERTVTFEFTVRAGSQEWAAIKVLAALARADSDQILSYRALIERDGAGAKEPEKEPERKPEVRLEHVASFTDPNKSYVVTVVDGRAVSCSCPNFVHRESEVGGRCKHMKVGGWW